MRPIDILYCDPLTPDNSNQWDEWEAKGGGGGESTAKCVSMRGLMCVRKRGREGEREGESSAQELLRSTKKKFTRRSKKAPFSSASLLCIHAV